MFSKTDLAKFENVWDDKPIYVNMGAQKNFVTYAKRIGHDWGLNSDHFNEFYFKKAVARAILFRKTEKLISNQPWYNGGYRANIVAYTLALLGKCATDTKKSLDFMKIWDKQGISEAMISALEITSKTVYDDIMAPVSGISNISEWCKKEGCWDRLQSRVPRLLEKLPVEFIEELLLKEEQKDEKKSAAKIQKMDNGIEAQKQVMNISAERWRQIMLDGIEKKIFSPGEMKDLQIAIQIPKKIPSEKQAIVLVNILGKAALEGININ